MAMPKTALEGIRILDLGRYQAGPRIGLVLAQHGAVCAWPECVLGAVQQRQERWW
jgi:crotonobetainyl-CoA:carnitine CoA-transferase CaiB-like acyl-CoA transferase